MKKLLFFVVIVGGVSALTACKKDWTCTCEGKILGTDYTADTTLTDMKKADAESTCDGYDYNFDADNNADCSID